MPKIQDIITEHNISREDLASAYKKAVGKALPARAANLKDEEWTTILPLIGGKEAASPKKSATKADKDEAKVLKSDEVFGGDDFLS